MIMYDERTETLNEQTMPVEIDKSLLYLTKRQARKDGLSDGERIALHLLWDNGLGVKVPILAKAFKVSKNTIYYKALTGDADSYPNSKRSNSAADTRAMIEELGVEEAKRRFITPEIKAAVERELKLELARRERRRK